MGKRPIAILIGLATTFLLLGAAPAAMGAARVYWSNYSPPFSLAHANLDGSGGSPFAPSGATVNGPAGMAFDPDTGKLYWANADVNVISFSNPDGSGGGNLNTAGATMSYPEGVSIFNGKLYFASRNTNTIGWVATDGSGGGDLNTTGATVDQALGVVVHPGQNRLYWTNLNDNSISYANLDGSGGGDLNTGAATLSDPEGLAIDPSSETVYWTNYGNSTIAYARLDGSGGGDLNIVGAAIDGPIGVAIDPNVDKIYWGNYASQAGDTIGVANLDGSGGADLVTTGAPIEGPVYPVLLKPPVGTAAPTISGSSTPGTLQCSSGSWANDLVSAFLSQAPRSFAYQWSRNGVDIAGATSNSYTATTTGDYRCRVEAGNAVGSNSQTSATHAVANPPRVRKLKVSPRKPRRPVNRLTFTMELSQDSKVDLLVQRKYGRKDRERCKRTKRKTRLGKRCPIYRRVSSTSEQLKAGKVKVRFNAKNLHPGAYRATVTATNGNGSSIPARVIFYRPWWSS